MKLELSSISDEMKIEKFPLRSLLPKHIKTILFHLQILKKNTFTSFNHKFQNKTIKMNNGINFADQK